MFQTRLFTLLILIVINFDCFTSEQNIDTNYAKNKVKPQLQLAKKYHENIVLTHYWISEKLDGVRGYWNGKELVTRNGNLIRTPINFTNNWPSTPLDGELWVKRNYFDQVSGCVRRKSPEYDCWQNIKFMVFDLPTHKGTFSERLKVMQTLVSMANSPYLKMIPQQQLNSKEQLFSLLDTVVSQGGEGLMLHSATAQYQIGRSSNILKLKHYQDAEATVIAHLPGKGKYQYMLGAIQVKTPEGIIFKIGSGFSDKDRENPPPINSIITYKYIGKTQRGVPRFASFMRIKSEH